MRETEREKVAVLGGEVVPASIVEAKAITDEAASEESLPFVMAEMALWGTAMSALMIPIGLFTLAASPFVIAKEMFRSRTQASVPSAA